MTQMFDRVHGNDLLRIDVYMGPMIAVPIGLRTDPTSSMSILLAPLFRSPTGLAIALLHCSCFDSQLDANLGES